MPKMKTRKCVKKRFRLTAKGHIKRKRAYRSHILGKKKTKRKRHLRGKVYVNAIQKRQIGSMLEA